MLLCRVSVAQQPYASTVPQARGPDAQQTTNYILDLVNRHSGATRSSESEDTTWTYSITSDSPCTFNLTEDRRYVPSTNAPGATAPGPVRQLTHYFIPVADLRFGRFSTHPTLEHSGFMRVVLFTDRAVIRRWHGDSPTPPPDAEVVFDASINFGKPDIDIFDLPLRLDSALEHLAFLCQGVAPRDLDPFRPY